MHIPEPDLSILLELVRKSVMRRWGWLASSDDILQESLVGAWQALTDCEAWVTACAHPGEDPHCRRVARRGGLSAAIEWLRGPQNQDRRVSRRGHAIPRSVSVEALAYEPVAPDFASEVDQALAAETALNRWRRALGAGQDWELVRRTVLEDEDLTEAARAMGLRYDSQLKRRHGQLLERLASLEARVNG